MNNNNNNDEKEDVIKDEWKKLKELTMNIKNGENKCTFQMNRDMWSSKQPKCSFRMRVRFQSYCSEYSNTVQLVITSEPTQISLKVVKCRKSNNEHPPENLLKSDDSYYGSPLNRDFNGNESDWIIFELSDNTSFHHLTQLQIKSRSDTKAPKEIKVECGEDINNTNWCSCEPNTISLQKKNEIQKIDLTNSHIATNGFKFIKVSFLQNYGEQAQGTRRYVVNELKLFAVK